MRRLVAEALGGDPRGDLQEHVPGRRRPVHLLPDVAGLEADADGLVGVGGEEVGGRPLELHVGAVHRVAEVEDAEGGLGREDADGDARQDPQ